MAKTAAGRWTGMNTGALLAVVLGTALSAAPAPANDTVNHLSRYCTACWRNARLPADIWPDCTQEVFVRLLERIPTESWNDALRQEGDEHRELLRAIDCVKKRVQRAKIAKPLPDDGVADRSSIEQANIAEDRELINLAAQSLTSRQREILRLWAEGHDVPSIAEQLAMSPARVSDEKYKAIHRLRKSLGIDAAA